MSALKSGLHPCNRCNGRYGLATLYQTTSELTQFLTLTPGGKRSVDFVDPQAAKTLNKALLAHLYTVKNRDIPNGFLYPPVPGRVDYIHHLVDLLDETNGAIPANASVLNVGMEANYIYSLIGMHEYDWRFTGGKISSEAPNSAQATVDASPGLTRVIRLRHQEDAATIFNGIIHKSEQYKATLCNPSFHDSATSARAGSERKRCNPGQDKNGALDFGGQQQELWYESGGVAFIKKMIVESQALDRQVMWFTMLVSHGENLPPLHHTLTDAGAMKVVKKGVAQEQRQSRFIARTLMDNDRRRRFTVRKH